MKSKLSNQEMDEIAKGIGAVRVGRVQAESGYFGAAQLAAEFSQQFQIPKGGGRPTNPEWTTRRLLPLAPKTLTQLEVMAGKLEKKGKVKVEPMQLAAMIVGRFAEELSHQDSDVLTTLLVQITPTRKIEEQSQVLAGDSSKRKSKT